MISASVAHRPLEAFPLMRTTDVDVLNDSVARTYGKSVIGFPSGTKGFHVHANHCQLQSIALTYASHAVPLQLDFSAFDHFAQFFAYRGQAEAIAGRRPVGIQESQSFVASRGDSFKLNYGRNFEQLVLRINPTALVKKLEALGGDHLVSQLKFNPSKIRPEYSESLRQMLLFGIERLDSSGSKFHPLALAEFEQSVLVAVLCGTQHNYSKWLDQQSSTAAPWQVRVAEEYIEANWDQPLTIEALSIVTGASARTIFHSFKRTRGYTPMDFVKNLRLQRANAMLATGTSVSNTALACGFGNFGHFANYYKIKFGELPSQTLKRARGA